MTLFIDIFYCLNYTSLLLHLIITHLVSHPFTIAFVPPCSFLSLFFFLFFFFYVFLSSIIFIPADTHQHHLLSLLHFAITSSRYNTSSITPFFFSCIVFIISTVIIGIFYCLNYTSLLLHLIITHLVSHPFTIAFVPPCSFLSLFFFFGFFFYVFLSSIIFIPADTHQHHLLSLLHFAITSSRYNTSSITPFFFMYCFHYLYGNYRHLLLIKFLFTTLFVVI